MHYSIQQEFARTRHADLLKEAEQARLADLGILDEPAASLDPASEYEIFTR